MVIIKKPITRQRLFFSPRFPNAQCSIICGRQNSFAFNLREGLFIGIKAPIQLKL
jgi:hypothetical protein